MIDHGARAHATWAASSTARNVHCPGALTLAALAPPQKESIHAARGTACHQIAEKCLRTGRDASEFLGDIEETKEHKIEIDEELVNSAQMYVDYVRSRDTDCQTTTWIEEKFKLDDLDPPFDAGGTGDAIIYDAETRTLEIVDLKNGMGVVDATENPQLRTYALGAMLHHKGLAVEWVKVTIVQPRAPHKDGRIRSETFHVVDLMEWTADLLAAMQRSRHAMDERAAAGNNSVSLDEWAETWLKPGRCKFCPAEGFCPALRAKAIDKQNGVVKVWFEDSGEPKISNMPDMMSPEELARTLDLLDLVEDWIKAVRGYAHAQAENGAEIPGYYLADKIGNRKWAAEDAKVVQDLRSVVKLTDDEIYETKLRSVAQIEKVLGSKRKAEIASMWHKPVTGKNLVSEGKSTRPPAKSKAAEYFEAS